MYVVYPAVIHVHACLNLVGTTECRSKWFKVLSTIITKNNI